MIRVAWLALSTLLLAAACSNEQPAEVHGTVERDRLEIIAGRELGGVEAPAGAAAPAAGATAAPTGGLTPQEAAELAELRKRFPPR